MIDCRKVQARLERAFVAQRWGELDALREHLAACPRCRRGYGRLFAAEGALAAADDDDADVARASARLSPSEQALLLRRALPAAVGAPRQRRELLAALAATALVLLAALWIPTRPSPSAPPTPAPRGAGAHDAARAPLGLRALCLERDGARFAARSLGTEPLHGVRPCERAGALGFTVRNETGAAHYLQVVLRAADGTALRAFPRGDAPEEIAAADDEQPLPGATSLQALIPGRVEVFGLFSRAPRREDLLASVREGRDAELARAGETLVRFAIEVGR